MPKKASVSRDLFVVKIGRLGSCGAGEVVASPDVVNVGRDVILMLL